MAKGATAWLHDGLQANGAHDVNAAGDADPGFAFHCALNPSIYHEYDAEDYDRTLAIYRAYRQAPGK